MNVLVVGSGGREHALAWKLGQSPELGELHAAPGNPGIAGAGTCHPVRADDVEALLGLSRELGIDLAVVGPEAPLVAGLADALRHAGVAVFGPSAAAARIEGSKSFAKEVMRAAGVPTAAELDEPRAPCVVKADGLAAGKGVFVCRTQAEAEAAWAQAEQLGERVVVEELLEGEEVSLFALCDGAEALALLPAQDFKRLRDGDEGPNTGGMGSYSPVPALCRGRGGGARRVRAPPRARRARRARDAVPGPALRRPHADRRTGRACSSSTAASATPRRRRSFRGSRATCSSLSPRRPTARSRGVELAAAAEAAVTVVLASPGYPEAPRDRRRDRRHRRGRGRGSSRLPRGHGSQGRGARRARAAASSTSPRSAPSVAEARDRAYDAVERIDFPGAQLPARHRREGGRTSMPESSPPPLPALRGVRGGGARSSASSSAPSPTGRRWSRPSSELNERGISNELRCSPPTATRAASPSTRRPRRCGACG